MNKEKQDALNHIEELKKQIAKYESIVNTPEKLSAKEWLEKIWFVAYRNSGCSEDNCATFYENSERKSDGWLFQQDWKNKHLYYNYYKIYQILADEYGISANEINTLVVSVVSKDLNCEGLTPSRVA